MILGVINANFASKANNKEQKHIIKHHRMKQVITKPLELPRKQVHFLILLLQHINKISPNKQLSPRKRNYTKYDNLHFVAQLKAALWGLLNRMLIETGMGNIQTIAKGNT